MIIVGENIIVIISLTVLPNSQFASWTVPTTQSIQQPGKSNPNDPNAKKSPTVLITPSSNISNISGTIKTASIIELTILTLVNTSSNFFVLNTEILII
jgi:hypothetical protein